MSFSIGGGGFALWKLFESNIHGLSVLTTVGLISGGFALLLMILVVRVCYDGRDFRELSEDGNISM